MGCSTKVQFSRGIRHSPSTEDQLRWALRPEPQYRHEAGTDHGQLSVAIFVEVIPVTELLGPVQVEVARLVHLILTKVLQFGRILLALTSPR